MTDPDLPAFANLSTNGLTKREYFAAMAMQGMITALTEFTDNTYGIIRNRPKDISELSLLYADTLIAALNRTEDKKHGE